MSWVHNENWIPITRGPEQARVRAEVLEQRIQQGWQVLGADGAPETPQVSQVSSRKNKPRIVDSGGIVAYPVKRKAE